MDLMLPAAWAMCMAIGGKFGGTASGIMNTDGNFGGFICTVVIGYVLAATGNYELTLQGVAAMVFIAAVLFVMIDCTKGRSEERRVGKECVRKCRSWGLQERNIIKTRNNNKN